MKRTNSNINSLAPDPQALIPNFCAGEAVWLLVFVMEMVALVLTLLTGERGAAALSALLMYSLYLQWMGICGAIVLCTARRAMTKSSVGTVFFVCWGLLMLVTTLIADGAWWLSRVLPIGEPVGETQQAFVLRNVCISAILSLLLLRYFWGRAQLQAQVKADAETQYLALQARIRPHFLFNSLNSIASLIATKPDQAEEMVLDLSELFRASLDKRNTLVKVSEEIEFVKTYMRIETVRLGDKLWVNWHIAKDSLDARIPLLILQPLVENAVHHGVSRLRGRGGIDVTVQREGQRLLIAVENPVPPEDAPKRESTGVALENISQRLKLIYGDSAELTQGLARTPNGSVYRAQIKVPYTTVDRNTGTVASDDEGDD
ncbi:MAG: histidine kinase [Stagnimonas sp.]|nr:histidine kinase [Stagnimonas sp.]